MKVKLREGQRSFDYDDTDFNLYGKEEKELEEKYIKSYSVKWALLNGQLIPIEGSLIINYKHAKVFISAEHFPYAYGTEFGKLFVRDVEMQTVVWKDKDNFPADIYKALDVFEKPITEFPKEELETPEEETEEEPQEETEEEPYTYKELKAMIRDQQIIILKKQGVPFEEIKKLRYEEDRIKKILEEQEKGNVVLFRQ